MPDLSVGTVDDDAPSPITGHFPLGVDEDGLVGALPLTSGTRYLIVQQQLGCFGLDHQFLAVGTSPSFSSPTGAAQTGASLQVTTLATAWDVVVEMSVDGLEWTELFHHTNANGSGKLVGVNPTIPFDTIRLRLLSVSGLPTGSDIRCRGVTSASA